MVPKRSASNRRLAETVWGIASRCNHGPLVLGCMFQVRCFTSPSASCYNRIAVPDVVFALSHGVVAPAKPYHGAFNSDWRPAMQPKTAAQLVQEAKQRIENLSVEQVVAERERGDAVIVDIREPEEQRLHGVIPGAVSAPRGMLEFYADPASPYHRPEFEPNRRVILHCAAGGRSALAADTLQQMGYTNVAHLEGGFNGWREAGQPVTTQETDSPESAQR